MNASCRWTPARSDAPPSFEASGLQARRRSFAVGGAPPTAENVDSMDVRLVQLLGSFGAARNQYVLARLEFALRHPADLPPPVIDRLLEPSERALREEWPQLEGQLDAALAFVRKWERSRRVAAAKDESGRYLQRSLRELDQYSRGIRWVLTVTEREHESG